jgi:carbon storage regulator
MLVLSRKAGESIQIAGGIIVSVVEIRGNQVRLGIKAPPAIEVVRSEIAEMPGLRFRGAAKALKKLRELEAED